MSEVMEAGKWPMNLGSERDWSFQSQPNAHLNGRSIHLAMVRYWAADPALT
jgi:choline dehydrogenase